MRGDLGFPHRGFPETITRNVLKGAVGTVRTIRAGLTLPPVDFAKYIASLESQFGVPISPEKAMSSLMYPKVFSDYMKRQLSKGGALIRYLPTPVYLHGMLPNSKAGFTMTVPSAALGRSDGGEGAASVEVRMLRVHPLKSGKRTVSFLVNGTESFDFDVKDTSGAFVFEGAMAVPGDSSTVCRFVDSPLSISLSYTTMLFDATGWKSYARSRGEAAGVYWPKRRGRRDTLHRVRHENGGKYMETFRRIFVHASSQMLCNAG